VWGPAARSRVFRSRDDLRALSGRAKFSAAGIYTLSLRRPFDLPDQRTRFCLQAMANCSRRAGLLPVCRQTFGGANAKNWSVRNSASGSFPHLRRLPHHCAARQKAPDRSHRAWRRTATGPRPFHHGPWPP
jgi:hypothetical protein